MSWILFIVYYTYGINRGISASDFRSKKACEIALKEAKAFLTVSDKYSRCIEVSK